MEVSDEPHTMEIILDLPESRTDTEYEVIIDLQQENPVTIDVKGEITTGSPTDIQTSNEQPTTTEQTSHTMDDVSSTYKVDDSISHSSRFSLHPEDNGGKYPEGVKVEDVNPIIDGQIEVPVPNPLQKTKVEDVPPIFGGQKQVLKLNPLPKIKTIKQVEDVPPSFGGQKQVLKLNPLPKTKKIESIFSEYGNILLPEHLRKNDVTNKN